MNLLPRAQHEALRAAALQQASEAGQNAIGTALVLKARSRTGYRAAVYAGAGAEVCESRVFNM